MTQPGYDERYAMPIEASRRGAHRARPNPLLGVLPIAGVAVVVAAVVLLAYTLFGSSLGGGSSSASGPLTEPTGGTSAAASAGAPTAAASGGAAASQGAQPSQDAQPSTDTGASPEASASAATGKVDKTIVLNFYNATKPVVEGLSRKAAAKLVADGWKQGAVASWTGVPVTQTTVFYSKATQKATAQAIVDALGVGVVKQATKPQKQILVVVSNDFQA